MFKPKNDKRFCPLLRRPCIEQECMWFVQLRGTHPQTGEPVDEWDCAIIWQPVLLIENSSQQRATGAAVESFRNEMVRANEQSKKMLLTAAQQQTIERSE